MQSANLSSQDFPAICRRRYSCDWLGRLPGLGEELQDLTGAPAAWASTPTVWTAAFRCVLRGRDILPGVAQRGIPYRALAVSLRILASARSLTGALELLREIARLANFPVNLEISTVKDRVILRCRYEKDDEGLRSDIEVLHVTFLMSVLQLLVGDHFPFHNFICRSPKFVELHPVHPDFNCPTIVDDFCGCSFDLFWLNHAVSEHVSEISLEETLVWLVHDHPEEFILPQREALDEKGLKVGDKTDALPVFKSVGGRQKRRKLVAQCGLTLRDLKQRYAVRRAKFMLVEGGRTISQIAVELGYTDEGNFRRFFKRMTGLAPIKFLKSPEYMNLKEICRLIHTLREFNA